MKIAELKTIAVSNPPPGLGGRHFRFLKLKTARGLEGVGEAYAGSSCPAAILAMLMGDAAAIAAFQAAKTSAWPDALAAIRASGETRLVSNFDFGVGKQVAYFDETEGAKLELTPLSQICADEPLWFVAEREDKRFAGEVELGAPDCRLVYRFMRAYGESGLSQTPWGLYRRDEASQ